MSLLLGPAPSTSSGHAPLRRAGSVRRTSSIDATWPVGSLQPLRLDGRGRDLLTRKSGDDTSVLAWDQIQAMLSHDRTVETIDCQPPRPGLQALVGARAGGRLRKALSDALPEERALGSPLYLLLDDFAGISLIAPWARQHWPGQSDEAAVAPRLLERVLKEAHTTEARTTEARTGPKEGVCIGFRPGASSLQTDPPILPNCADVIPLMHPDDAVGWHALPVFPGMSMRRARRIDVWREGDEICVDTMFQDSASTPTGPRKAVHEYSLAARANVHSLKLTRLLATPRILPFPECPAAVANIDRLIGLPLSELRIAVLEQLPKTLGCTHLNDALRALAEVPMLFNALDAAG